METLTSYERYLIKYYLRQKLSEMKFNDVINAKIEELEKIINKLYVF